MIITFRVEERTARLFKTYAEENNTSVSALLREMLTERIEKDNKKPGDGIRKEEEKKKNQKIF